MVPHLVNIRTISGATQRFGLFPKTSEVACKAHIRRKLMDVFAAQWSAIAEEAIKRTAELCGVEKQGAPPEDRLVLRQSDANSIFDNLEKWLHAQLPKYPENHHGQRQSGIP